MGSPKKVVEFLLVFKPRNRIRKAVNVAPEKLVILEEDTDRFISVADIKFHVNPKEPTISATVLHVNVS
jgi:hypothetical protein